MIFFLCAAEQARVSLSPLRGMKGTDYINASYITVHAKCFCSQLDEKMNSMPETKFKNSNVCVCYINNRVTTGVMSSLLPSIHCLTQPLTSGG